MPAAPDELLARIVAWAQADANVRALIVTGSRARLGATPDEFSDHDLEIIAARPDDLAAEDAWLRAFGPIWAHLPLYIGQRYPTRLVFYEGGMKVDFSLCGIERVREMVDANALDSLYERGYRVLLDKDGITADLPLPTGKFPIHGLPTQDEFAAAVIEFWFEAAHIPRYILRGELWVVKFRDWTMKTLLLTMLEWRAVARNGAPVDVWHMGIHMNDWLDDETRGELRRVFSRFDSRVLGRPARHGRALPPRRSGDGSRVRPEVS